jgi:hypothetical protein
VALGEVARDERAEAAGAAGDEDGPVGVERRRLVGGARRG